MSEPRGFEVRDRRRVRPDGGVTPEDVAEAAGSSQFVSGEHLDELLDSDSLLDDSPEDAADEAMEQIRVGDLLGFFTQELITHAWVGCGLWANPRTGRVEQNLPEAKKAIDLLGDLAKHAEAELDPTERRRFQNELATLRLNYISQCRAAGAP